VITKHILVVDDNAHIRKAMCDMILQDKRFLPCTEAANGWEGVQRATETWPDLVVMDYSMPVMNGLEAARRMTALMPNLRIILVTLHAEAMDSVKLANYGISVMVSKQEASTELVPTICSLLGINGAVGAA
jgi:CheY-like chemotaxis protein